jgi:hypothetical protein
MQDKPTLTLRQNYAIWVEDRIEGYKNGITRSQLLHLADEACEELRTDRPEEEGITEEALAAAVDRKILTFLKLPDFRLWSRTRRSGGVQGRAGDRP